MKICQGFLTRRVYCVLPCILTLLRPDDECRGLINMNIGGGQSNNHCTGYPGGNYIQTYQGVQYALGGWMREPVYSCNYFYVF